MNAGEICTAARDLHPAFDPRRHPQATLHRFLTRYQRDLAAKMILVDEVSLTATQTIALPLADFAAGVTLDEHEYLNGGDLIANTADDPVARRPLTILPWGNRFQQAREPSSFVVGDTLMLRGKAADWLAYASIELRYTPVAGTISADSDAMILPKTALNACVMNLASFMASKGHMDKTLPPINGQAIAATALQAEADFLEVIFQHRSGKTNRVREVRSYS